MLRSQYTLEFHFWNPNNIQTSQDSLFVKANQQKHK